MAELRRPTEQRTDCPVDVQLVLPGGGGGQGGSPGQGLQLLQEPPEAWAAPRDGAPTAVHHLVAVAMDTVATPTAWEDGT
ncbi:hypothetical protein CRUP_023077 [Coryphaenoides rupestris]|nr:hypothetical protein CRUP_023077 [Coryphaenoides rupestris]